ncbi:MAG TPA: hypothetical protein VKK31_23590 [Thermoanaerobaculia bacterium]|nr:hypothetical protein [Thermoanaerobaculia bacterium]
MRIATRTLLTLILGVVLAAMAAAQGNKPIGQVEIVVKDVNSKQDIATVQPGGTVELPAGAHVRLIMTALPTGSARGPMYPATTFSDTAQGGVTITRSNAENSTADLRLNNAKNSGRLETIRYQITDTNVPANLRTGSFTIRVMPANDSGVSTGGVSTGGTIGSRAEQLTRLLYQAILLRDLDSGARGTIESIQRGGYDALVQAAVGIANSDESRRLAATPADQRLASLYRVLLGITPEQADAGQWSADIDLMNRGRFGDVVSGIVQSDRFRERHNLAGVRY